MKIRMLAQLDQVHSFLRKDQASETYSCTVRNIRERVAVKVCTGVLSSEAGLEVEALMRCKHPHLVRVLDVIYTSHLCVVRRLYNGDTLDALLHRSSKAVAYELTTQHRLQAVAEIVSAVAYLHESSIVHSDVRPQNVFLKHPVSSRHDGIGFVPAMVLGDLGLSRFLKDRDDDDALYLDPGVMCYTAPEVLMHDLYETAADVFSCGVVMYEVLTGRIPYFDEGLEDHVLMAKVCAGLRPRLAHLHVCRAQEPLLLSRVVAEAWESDPGSRMTSAALEEHLCGLTQKYRLS